MMSFTFVQYPAILKTTSIKIFDNSDEYLIILDKILDNSRVQGHPLSFMENFSRVFRKHFSDYSNFDYYPQISSNITLILLATLLI